MLRGLLEDHSREHNNSIVQKLAEVLNVERYEVTGVDFSASGNDQTATVTAVVSRATTINRTPKPKSKKPRRMIQT
jgi:hypothetical protein